MADAILILHLAFILFAVLGGLIALRWTSIAWVHLPAVAWASLVELCGWPCPLTPLEDRFRGFGDSARATSFIERYLLPTIYPAALTPELQLLLGVGVVVLNAAIYVAVWRGKLR